MKIVICGAGVVGSTIARYLAEKNDVTVIDHNSDRISNLSQNLDIKGLVGNGARPDILAQADAQDADMLIAVTQSDEVNMVACQAAWSLFHVPTRIARIRDQKYLGKKWAQFFGRDNMPIDVVISPEREVAQTIARRLEIPGANELIFLANNSIGVVGLRCDQDDDLVGHHPDQLMRSVVAKGIRAEVLGLYREGSFSDISPEISMMVGDTLYLLLAKNDIDRLMVLWGRDWREVRHIVQIGAGNIGLSLAQIILERFGDVHFKIIDSDSKNAERATKILGKKGEVLCGNGLDPDILNEANIQAAEAFVAVTSEDESNILSSLLAKHYGCPQAICLVNKAGYEGFIADLGIDTIIDPRMVTISTILQHVRRGRVLSVHSLADGSGEILEFGAIKTSPLVGRSLSQVDWPYGVRFGAVIRKDGEFALASDDPTVHEEDRIILFSPIRSVSAVEDLFAAKLEQF